MALSPRVIAIGDVHGCATALAALIDALALSRDDTLIVLGDVIDRGPDSRGVVEQLLALDGRCRTAFILGNHEQMMLDALAGQMAVKEWLGFGGAQTVASYSPAGDLDAIDDAHLEFFRSWGDVHETAGSFFAHGSYLPGRPLDRQPWYQLRWQAVDERPPGPHCSGKTAVVGHTCQKDGEILNLGHLVCLDTYCWGGKWLTALDVVWGRTWQSNEAGEVRRGKLPPVRAAHPKPKQCSEPPLQRPPLGGEG